MYITIHEPTGPRIITSEKQFEDYKKDKVVIEAAGGLVFNEKGELLMIFRRGHWDLPKGKVDEGETLEECALREVTEETGLINICIKQFLKTTYHTYQHQSAEVIKVSHWYEMMFSGEEEFKPQYEEDITQIEWVTIKDLSIRLEKSYPNIIQLLKNLS